MDTIEEIFLNAKSELDKFTAKCKTYDQYYDKELPAAPQVQGSDLISPDVFDNNHSVSSFLNNQLRAGEDLIFIKDNPTGTQLANSLLNEDVLQQTISHGTHTGIGVLRIVNGESIITEEIEIMEQDVAKAKGDKNVNKITMLDKEATTPLTNWYTIEYIQKNTYIEAIDPINFIVSNDFRELEKNSLIGERKYLTEEEAKELGLNDIDNLKNHNKDVDDNTTTTFIEVFECFIQQGGGIKQLWLSDQGVIHKESKVDSIPFIYWSIVNKNDSIYKSQGISEMSITHQKEKTKFLRRMHDNIKTSSLFTRLINKDTVSEEAMDQLNEGINTSTVVGVENPQESIFDIQTPFNGDKINILVQDVDKRYKDMIGISGIQSVNPLSNQAATTSVIQYTQATMKLRAYARNLVMGVKRIVSKLTDTDIINISVGLSSEKERRIMELQQSLTLMQSLSSVFDTTKQIIAITKELNELYGIISEPLTPLPQFTDPKQELEQTKTQALIEKQANELTLNAQETAANIKLKERELELKERELQLKEKELHLEAELTAFKIQSGQNDNTLLDGDLSNG